MLCTRPPPWSPFPHHSTAVWLLIPMKFWNILKQRLPVIRPAQMGYRRRICLKRQKGTLTVKAELKRSVRYLPNPHHHYHHNPPPHPSSQRDHGGRVQQVCLLQLWDGEAVQQVWKQGSMLPPALSVLLQWHRCMYRVWVLFLMIRSWEWVDLIDSMFLQTLFEHGWLLCSKQACI